MSRKNLRRRLFVSVYLVPFVKEDYSWPKPFQPAFFNIAVTEDDGTKGRQATLRAVK
jgi:hypothetical protein